MSRDYDAMEEWLRHWSPILLRHLVKIGANREDARDIVQEALCKWWVQIDAVNPDRATAWLFRVTVNLYYDLCRKQQRTRFVAWDESFLIEEKTPETIVLTDEERHRSQRAFEALSMTQQHLLLLKYGQGLSYAAIGTLMGYPPSTVSTYLHRARAQFRKGLEVEEEI